MKNDYTVTKSVACVKIFSWRLFFIQIKICFRIPLPENLLKTHVSEELLEDKSYLEHLEYLLEAKLRVESTTKVVIIFFSWWSHNLVLAADKQIFIIALYTKIYI